MAILKESKIRKIIKSKTDEICKIYKIINKNNNKQGFIKIFSKAKNKHYFYNIEAIKDENKLFQILKSFGNVDVYISLNQFRTMGNATKSNVLCINAIAVDIDFRNIKIYTGLETWQVIELLELDYFDVKIPTPNFIEKSNQIRLIYNIETCFIPLKDRRVATLAQRVSIVFAEQLKEFGAEKQGFESFMRVVGTINSKNDSVVELIDYGLEPYILRDLQELWMESAKWSQRMNGRTKADNKPNRTVIKIHNVYILNTNRLLDFEKVQAWLNSLGETNFRSRLCFLYRNYVLIRIKYSQGELKEEDYEYAKEEVLKFNSKFNNPLREKDLISATNVVDSRQYLYKNKTLMEYLELGIEDCTRLGLESLFEVKNREDIDKDYYQRNKELVKESRKKRYEKELKQKGETKKADKVYERRQKIKDLLAKGLSSKNICSKLEISKATYLRDLKHI